MAAGKGKSEQSKEPRVVERVSTWSTRHGIIRVREMGGDIEAVQLARDAKVPASWVPLELFLEAQTIVGELGAAGGTVARG